MLTKKEIIKRQHYLGGSDQAVVMGIDPFRDDFTMMMEKAKGYTQEIAENKFMIAGNMLEKVCLEYFARSNDLDVTHTQAQFTNPVYPYLKSRVDGKAIGEEVTFLVEAKTQFSKNFDKWQNGPLGVRDSHYYQGIFNAGNMYMAEKYKYSLRASRLELFLTKHRHKLPTIQIKGLEAKIEHYKSLDLIKEIEEKPSIKVVYPVLFLNIGDYRKIMELHNNGYTGEWEELFAVYLSDKQLNATPKEVQKQVNRLQRKGYKITENDIKLLIFENKMLKLLQRFKKKYYEVSFDFDLVEFNKLIAANNHWWQKYKVNEEVPLPSSKSYKMIMELSPMIEKGKILMGGEDIERFIRTKISKSIRRKSAKKEYRRLIRDHDLLSRLEDEIAEFDEEIKSIDAVLKFTMGSAEKLITDDYEAILVPVERLTLNFDKLQEDHPELIKDYLGKKVDTNRLYTKKLDISEEIDILGDETDGPQ